MGRKNISRVYFCAKCEPAIQQKYGQAFDIRDRGKSESLYKILCGELEYVFLRISAHCFGFPVQYSKRLKGIVGARFEETFEADIIPQGEMSSEQVSLLEVSDDGLEFRAIFKI